MPFNAVGLGLAERTALTESAASFGPHLAAMIKDDDRCIRCGLCALRCPTGALTMERITVVDRSQSVSKVRSQYETGARGAAVR